MGKDYERRYNDEEEAETKQEAPRKQFSKDNKSNNKNKGGNANKGKSGNNNKFRGFQQSAGQKKSFDQLKNSGPDNLSYKSNDNNDYMIKVGFMLDGFQALTTETYTPSFKLDYSAYITLVRKSYIAVSKSDTRFSDAISLSAYEYYCVLLLWRRILEIQSDRGDFRVEYDQFKTKLTHTNIQVPKDIEIYLAGIGDVVDFTEVKAKLVLNGPLSNLEINGLRGTFGRLDANTHILYETLPAPFILVQRMIEDMKATDSKIPSDWDLPPELQPQLEEDDEPVDQVEERNLNEEELHQQDEDQNENNNADANANPYPDQVDQNVQQQQPAANVQAGGTLTVNSNLLGWKRSEIMPSSQYNTLTSAGFIVDENQQYDCFENVGNIPFCEPLVFLISETLLRLKIEVSQPLDTAQTSGSKSQILFAKPDPSDVSYNKRLIASTRKAFTKSHAQTNINIAGAAAAFRYRFKRSLDNTDIHSLCYTVNHTNGTKEALPGWMATENDIFKFCPFSWNDVRFTSAPTVGTDALDSVSSKYYIPKRLQNVGK